MSIDPCFFITVTQGCKITDIMRFAEVWVDWRGSHSARQIIMPGANVEVGGIAKTGAVMFSSCDNRYLTWYVIVL